MPDHPAERSTTEKKAALITAHQLKVFADNNAHIEYTVLGHANGFHLAILFNNQYYYLSSDRGVLRNFAGIDSAAKFLHKINSMLYVVDTSHCQWPAKTKSQALEPLHLVSV